MTTCRILADLSEADRRNLIVWLGILMGVVIVGFTAILLLRRWLRDPSGGESQDPGFSLSELRAMRDRGEITPEEYEQTRARVIAKVKASTAAMGPGKGARISDVSARIVPPDAAGRTDEPPPALPPGGPGPSDGAPPA
jgi:hypothetical protein